VSENSEGGLRAAFFLPYAGRAYAHNLQHSIPRSPALLGNTNPTQSSRLADLYNDRMPPRPSPIAALLAAYKSGETNPTAKARIAFSRANGNVSRNTYLAMDPDWTLGEARRQLKRATSGDQPLPLSGLPVSLKDCFDLTGFPTSIGSKFYAANKPDRSPQTHGSPRVRRNAGAVIVGKTHLHQLAYGVTGENRDYGDCLQPADSGTPHRRLFQWRGGVHPGRLGARRHRHRYRRLGSRSRRTLRTHRLSRLAGHWRLDRRLSSGAIV
jgi:hypothetical protein